IVRMLENPHATVLEPMPPETRVERDGVGIAEEHAERQALGLDVLGGPAEQCARVSLAAERRGRHHGRDPADDERAGATVKFDRAHPPTEPPPMTSGRSRPSSSIGITCTWLTSNDPAERTKCVVSSETSCIRSRYRSSGMKPSDQTIRPKSSTCCSINLGSSGRR